MKVAPIALAALAMLSSPAGAQDRSPQPSAPARQPLIELSASLVWLASSSLGVGDANLTSNNTQGTPYRLFTASGNYGNVAGVEARVAYHFIRHLALEAGVTYSRPAISFTVSNDAEGAAGFTAEGETLSQLFVDASLVAYPVPAGFSRGRVRPFVEVGGGFLRELHGQTGAMSGYFSSETGRVFHGGGGVRYVFRVTPGSRIKSYALRFDARYYVRDGGFSFGESHPRTFATSAGLVMGF